jgi:transcriptional regulator with XRE-family HTH domain
MGDRERKRAEVGRRLKQAINAAGLSQSAFADEVGTTQATVSRWTKGENQPRELDTWLTIATVLNVPAVELLWPIIGESEKVDGVESALLAAEIDDAIRTALLTMYRVARGSQ